MVPTAFDEENQLLEPPRGMTAEECDTISVWTGALTSGTPVVISCWKVTKEELEEIKRTGRVWLMVLGANMPPVALSTEKPFNESV